jgi:putative holliday junction resolvase
MPEPGTAPAPHSTLPASTTVLAFDFGEKRVGVAVGETALATARPLTVVEAEDNRSRFHAITALIQEWQPGLLVVGLPVHADGAEHELTRLARRFAQRLHGRYGLPVALVDERYTSHEAESALRERGVRGARIRRELDAVAAAEILRAYHETERSRTRNATRDVIP